MTEFNYEFARQEFIEWYRREQKNFDGQADSARALVAGVLRADTNLSVHSVTSRVKDVSECLGKFDRKYRRELEENGSPYSIRDSISDLIGVRVVCYYEPDIASARRALGRNFQVHEETDKTREIESEGNAFGYRGFHMDLGLSHARKDLPEYLALAGMRFEVQIRTVVQDAWSVLDHKLNYKRNIDPDLKRSVYRLAALAETLDREFLSLRDATTLRQEKASEADRPSQSERLDVFSFKAVVEKSLPELEFYGRASDDFVSVLLSLDDDLRASDLESFIERNKAETDRYAEHMTSVRGRKPNPFTYIRHLLYLADGEKFGSLLYPIQRRALDQWRDERRERAAPVAAAG
jgi:ppGpp synthetase/RelA/SpoT-type nucleotidyltranferase